MSDDLANAREVLAAYDVLADDLRADIKRLQERLAEIAFLAQIKDT